MTRWVSTLVLAMLVTACVTSTEDDASVATGNGGGDVPADCQEIPVAVSSEKVTLLTDLAERFNERSPEIDGRCVAVTVHNVASGLGASLLAEGWPAEETTVPAPVLWSPAASSWGAVVNHRLELQGEPPIATDFERIMITPLVLGMPRPMAEALGWPEADIGWADVLALAQDPDGWGSLGRPEWGPFRLGKTNPNFSTSGLSATVAIYYAATGKTSGLTLDDIGSQSVTDFVGGVEQAVVHYGDTTLTFLDNMLREDLAGRPLTYASAVAVEEVSIVAYNRGDPADRGLEDPTPPNVPLVAVYPEEGTLFSDNPAFLVDAPWVDDVARRAGEQFRAFVVDDPDNQARVLDFGFRPGNPGVPLGDPITPENGLIPSQPTTELEVPSGRVLAGLVDSWEQYRKTARVILVLDVSGSMGELAGEGFTKLDLAKRAALASLDQFKPEDEVGLWIFSTGLGGGDVDHVELVAPAPLSDTRPALESGIRGLVADGGTGLHDTTRAAVQAVREGFDQTKINAVVLLTDGICDDPTPPGCDIDSLETFLASSERDTVRVFPVAYGADASVDELQAIAEASRARLYTSPDPNQIEQVFSAVISNF